MAKKRKITELQFKLGIAVFALLIIGLIYFGYVQDCSSDNEINLDEKLLSEFGTEFCAVKLIELTYEANFIKKELVDEEIIEQRELKEVMDEFTEYERKCLEFDQNPNREHCGEFLKESKLNLDISKSNHQGIIGIEYNTISLKNYRAASRIYGELLMICNNLE